MKKKEITKARESLRSIYGKYANELYAVIEKIDKMLESLGEQAE